MQGKDSEPTETDMKSDNIIQGKDSEPTETDINDATSKHLELSALPSGRLCAIDFGLKRIGFALSNKVFNLATQYKTIDNKGFANTKLFIEESIKKHQIIGFVVGWPLTPNGDESTQCKLVENFCQKLLQAFNLPIYKFDERYSTKNCKHILLTSSKKNKKQATDHTVAAFFLQEFLDYCS